MSERLLEAVREYHALKVQQADLTARWPDPLALGILDKELKLAALRLADLAEVELADSL